MPPATRIPAPPTAAPGRSLTQRMEALAKANRSRSARKDWKREVKHEGRDPTPVIRRPPPEFESMKVYAALLAVPKVGRVKAHGILDCARISPSKTLAGISDRQRGELLGLLQRRG
jgi:hypothetical protein